MRLVFFLLLCVQICAHAEWDQLFSEEEDSSLFHHVNVITGNLNICLQDGVVQGAKTIPLFRTYSSSGALERSWRKSDLTLREDRGLLIQGGWSFFPHSNLLIDMEGKPSKLRAYLPEPGGNFIEYGRPRRIENGVRGERILKPKLKPGQCSGNLSGRTNPQNNRLIISVREGTATLYLPNGGVRHYVGERLGVVRYGDHRRCYYRLVREKLPSQHEICYEYDRKEQLKRISVKNPCGKKTYAWANVELFKKSPPFHFQLTTSDGKRLDYQAIEFKERDYLATVKSNIRSDEIALYSPGRKGTGARIEQFAKGGGVQLKVSYYLPPNEKAAKKWAEDPDKKDFWGDKVSMIEAPIGPSGEMLPIAHYKYCKEFTDVRDNEGILTRFFHDGTKLTRTDNYDEKGLIYSSTQFLWEGERLCAKVKLDARGEPLLAKTFKYDIAGNVIEETLFGNITGNALGRFSLNGSVLANAESLSKRITYEPKFNLPVLEEEEEGPTSRFFYKSGTDLLTMKCICDKEKIVKREIFEYDDDHLLIGEIIDDGTSTHPQDLSGVTMRQIKRYTLDPVSGLTKTVREYYLDLESGSEQLLKKSELFYSPENLVTREDVYDSRGVLRYTLYTDYEKGRVVRKTTPLGNENFYRYDALGNLIESKEVGLPHKTYAYDALGRPHTCIEKDACGEKIVRSVYDSKGRLLKQIDARGNTTEQVYDCFGRSIQTLFPKTLDDAGESYSPAAHFSYDVQGNIVATTTVGNERTETDYNAFRKPIEVRHADGSCLRYWYNKNGTLQKTIYPDGTEIHYTYDLFQRMTSKVILSGEGEALSQEKWNYSTFHLLSYTDPRGLTTHYIYDGAGRKIEERSFGRTKRFSYDALGFLEKTSEKDVTHVQLRDVEGNVVEEWIEEENGRIENRMSFFYDKEGKKEKALRLTSQGEAVDRFAYDGEGRLIRHVDPEGHETQFVFKETETNSLDQRVLQKEIIDALGNAAIETFDALNRLVKHEKRDPMGNLVSCEEYLYDRSGNRTKRKTSVFQKNRKTHEISAAWIYDEMGRVKAEIEDEKRVTQFTYDLRGRIETRTLANGTVLSYRYDSIDRLLEMKSSDGTIHLIYFYEQGPEPTKIQDLVNKIKLTRSYNLFGELIEEKSSLGLHYIWERDDRGRVTRFILPDESGVAYTYEGSHLISVARQTEQGQTLYAHDYISFDVNGHVEEESLISKIKAKTRRDLLERAVSFTSTPLSHETSYGPTNLVIQTRSTLFGEKRYAYDALGQLEEEGIILHNFDSIGNPVECKVGQCNEIESLADCALTYDACGNPSVRKNAEQEVHYRYDALGRLIRISYPHEKEIHYIYDPLSRLAVKKVVQFRNGVFQNLAPVYFLYDQNREIGTLNSQGDICELKVLGVGIQGEIGAAVAIELQGTPYAPISDFQGNIVALVSSDAEIVEQYEISAFGKEKTDSAPLNPWRFSSKRHEDQLIFFGYRYYDPTLGRWLTPDPAGFADGPNLYLFVFNSPLNRLDLFGLSSAPNYFPEMRLEVPITRIQPATNIGELIQCKGTVGQVRVDWVVSCDHWHKIQFSAEELKAGSVNIFDHFHELIPKNGSQIGLITAQNGMHTKLDKYTNGMCRSIRDKTPEGTLFVGIHLPSNGFFKDIWRAVTEFVGKETPEVCVTRQILGYFADTLHKLNPDLLWLHIVHSEGGLVSKHAIKGLPPEQKAQLQKQLYLYAIGPAKPIPRGYGFKVYNVYSSEDMVTGLFGRIPWLFNSKYDITYIPSELNAFDRLMRKTEHGFMGKTYQKAFWEQMSSIRGQYGFYNDAVR